MLCRDGGLLLSSYRRASTHRSEMRDAMLLATERGAAKEELLFLAKQSYSEAFVAWVTHRGFCLDCRSQSIQEDRSQFASV